MRLIKPNNSIPNLYLEIPDSTHKAEYERVMDKWEKSGEKIQPSLMRRGAADYEKWLEYCEDDRTKGSMLADNVPCTLYFALNEQNEIVGAIEINHYDTTLGHIHFGIVPWHRGKGYGTAMLASTLKECKKMGMSKVHICPSSKENTACIHTVLKNGGYLIEEFDYDGIIKQRYEIDLG